MRHHQPRPLANYGLKGGIAQGTENRRRHHCAGHRPVLPTRSARARRGPGHAIVIPRTEAYGWSLLRRTWPQGRPADQELLKVNSRLSESGG